MKRRTRIAARPDHGSAPVPSGAGGSVRSAADLRHLARHAGSACAAARGPTACQALAPGDHAALRGQPGVEDLAHDRAGTRAPQHRTPASPRRRSAGCRPARTPRTRRDGAWPDRPCCGWCCRRRTCARSARPCRSCRRSGRESRRPSAAAGAAVAVDHHLHALVHRIPVGRLCGSATGRSADWRSGCASRPDAARVAITSRGGCGTPWPAKRRDGMRQLQRRDHPVALADAGDHGFARDTTAGCSAPPSTARDGSTPAHSPIRSMPVWLAEAELAHERAQPVDAHVQRERIEIGVDRLARSPVPGRPRRRRRACRRDSRATAPECRTRRSTARCLRGGATPYSNPASPMNGFTVEPGGYTPRNARLNSGLSAPRSARRNRPG